MNFLQERIEKEGSVLSEKAVKVDSFLNHTVDPDLMVSIGKAFAGYFQDLGITKVLTIEAGGIAPALMTALYLHVPLVYCKKALPSTMTDPVSTEVYSFTKQKSYTLCMEKAALDKGDVVLFIDDFLADGQAFKGIEDLCAKRQASLAGCGFCIEKSFQKGRPYIEQKGYRLCSLAPILKLENGRIIWNEQASCSSSN